MNTEKEQAIYTLVQEELGAKRWVPGIPELIYNELQVYVRLTPAMRESTVKYLTAETLNWYNGYCMYKDDRDAPASKNERGFGEKLTALLLKFPELAVPQQPDELEN